MLLINCEQLQSASSSVGNTLWIFAPRRLEEQSKKRAAFHYGGAYNIVIITHALRLINHFVCYLKANRAFGSLSLIHTQNWSHFSAVRLG